MLATDEVKEARDSSRAKGAIFELCNSEDVDPDYEDVCYLSTCLLAGIGGLVSGEDV